MQFKDIVGQTDIKKYLLKTVHDGKISHAQLFLGKSGSGNLPMALAFAQYLNCEDKREDDSCGLCPSCSKISKYVHPDLHFSFPIIALKKEKKEESVDYYKEWRKALLENPYLTYNQWLVYMDADKKQGNIPIRECHAIIKKLSLKSFEATYKIQIIWLPEFLGKEGNALLKLIEEPPDNTVIILVAVNIDQILNTIISRTQILRFKPIQTEDLSAHLIQAHKLDASTANRLSYLALGDLNQAKSLIETQSDGVNLLLQRWIKCLLKGHSPKNPGSLAELNKVVEEFSRLGREFQKRFLQYGLELFKDLISFRFANTETHTLEEEAQLINLLDKGIQSHDIHSIYDWLNQAHYEIERNANPKILLFDLSLQISDHIQNKGAKESVINTIRG